MLSYLLPRALSGFCVLAVAGFTATASAQDVVDLGKLDAGSSWIGMAAAMFLAVCVMVGSFMSSKRGHQD